MTDKASPGSMQTSASGMMELCAAHHSVRGARQKVAHTGPEQLQYEWHAVERRADEADLGQVYCSE